MLKWERKNKLGRKKIVSRLVALTERNCDSSIECQPCYCSACRWRQCFRCLYCCFRGGKFLCSGDFETAAMIEPLERKNGPDDPLSQALLFSRRAAFFSAIRRATERCAFLQSSFTTCPRLKSIPLVRTLFFIYNRKGDAGRQYMAPAIPCLTNAWFSYSYAHILCSRMSRRTPNV